MRLHGRACLYCPLYCLATRAWCATAWRTPLLPLPLTPRPAPCAVPRLERLLVELEARLAAGEKLYIHCWGGRGRAGTVGSCLLARVYGLGAEEALERVQRSFDTRRDDNRRSPETEEQLAFVRRFIGARA